ncbi:MAG: hypothetical protein GKR90_05025 [Pseudomonadales bacterium]|nr:hypothetical protein [Pseudomonadales bacterium]
MTGFANSFTQALRTSSLGRWYAHKERTEQRVVLAVLILVIASVLWVGAWKPVSDWRAIAVNKQQNAQSLNDWLRANENAAKQAARSRSGEVTSRRSLTPLVTKAADAHQITVNRLQPEGNGIVSVSVQGQPFNKIVAWVSQLEENNGITVERASIDSVDAPGFVNAQIRLN